MRGPLIVVGWLGLALTAFAEGPASDPSEGRARVDPPGLRASQLSLSGETSLGQVHFRGTVLAKDSRSILLLTAAHCLAPRDAGRTLKVAQGDSAVEAKVRAVARNPAFGQGPPGAEIPGADNALVVLDLAEEDRPTSDWLTRLEPAELSPTPVPAPEGQMVPVYTIDQFEKAHGVRAGNYSNPRWLEWGSAYLPVPGDSGGGVFAYHRRPEGPPQPVLIGVVTDRSFRGGGASVVSRSDGWLARILHPPEPPRSTDNAEEAGR